MRHLAKINFRVLMLLATIGLPLCWYGYVFANQMIYHGVKPHDGWTEVDLRTLGAFPFDEAREGIEHVPPRFRALDGKRISLEGLMVSSNDAGDAIDRFQLVYNKQVCCLGGPPKVQERVFARCARGKNVKYAGDMPVELMGILHVNVVRDEAGVAIAVYTLDVESVEPL